PGRPTAAPCSPFIRLPAPGHPRWAAAPSSSAQPYLHSLPGSALIGAVSAPRRWGPTPSSPARPNGPHPGSRRYLRESDAEDGRTGGASITRHERRPVVAGKWRERRHPACPADVAAVGFVGRWPAERPNAAGAVDPAERQLDECRLWAGSAQVDADV